MITGFVRPVGFSPSALKACSMFLIWPSVSSRWCLNCCFNSSFCARFSDFLSIVRIFFSPESTVPSLYANSLRGSLISAMFDPLLLWSSCRYPGAVRANGRGRRIPALCEIRLSGARGAEALDPLRLLAALGDA